MKPRAPKRPRTERKDDRGIELTERDTDLLVLVGLTRLISSEQISRELFPSDDRGRRRVRQLYDAGYVAVTLASSTRPNLVSLTKKGLECVRERFPALATQLHTAGPLKMSELDHRLLAIDARLYAAALGEKRNAPLLSWAHGAGTLAMSCGLDAYHLEPDAVAELEASHNILVAVEVVSTVKPVPAIAKRLPRYWALATDERLDALWVATPDEKSAHAVQELLVQHVLDGWARALPRDHLIARPVRELPERLDHERPKGLVGGETLSGVSEASPALHRTVPRR